MTHEEQVLDAVMMALGHDHQVHPNDPHCAFLRQAADILIAVQSVAA